MRKEKGITLIALVITIIVMLILVAVTITVAINGGLFSKADDAAKKMQIEADREELQAALLDTMDNDGKVHLIDGTDNAGNTVYGVAHYLDTNTNHEEHWVVNGQSFTKHHKNGDENEFTVTIDANGGFTITYIEPSNSGEEPTEPEEENEGIVPDIEFVEVHAGLIGSVVTVNDIEYVIISTDSENGTIDLMSRHALGSLTLGPNDPNAITNATDLNNDGNISEVERALYSYNNAVEPIVMACVTESGIETVDGKNVISIRSFGNTNIKYTSEGLIGRDEPGWYSGNFSSIINEELKAEDENYLNDDFVTYFRRTAGTAFVASRFVAFEHVPNSKDSYFDRDYIYFGIRSLSGGNNLSSYSLVDYYVDTLNHIHGPNVNYGATCRCVPYSYNKGFINY